MRPRAPLTRPKVLAVHVPPSPGASVTVPRRASSLSPPQSAEGNSLAQQRSTPIQRDVSVATSPLLGRYDEPIFGGVDRATSAWKCDTMTQIDDHSPLPAAAAAMHADIATSPLVQQPPAPQAIDITPARRRIESPSPRRHSPAGYGRSVTGGSTPVFVGWSASDAHTGRTPSVKDPGPIRLVAPAVAKAKGSATVSHGQVDSGGYFRPLRSSSQRSPSYGGPSNVSVSRSTVGPATAVDSTFVLVDRRRAAANIHDAPRLEVVEVADDEDGRAGENPSAGCLHKDARQDHSRRRTGDASPSPYSSSPQSPALCDVEVDDLSPGKKIALARPDAAVQAWSEGVVPQFMAAKRSISSSRQSSVHVEMDDVLPALSPTPARRAAKPPLVSADDTRAPPNMHPSTTFHHHPAGQHSGRVVVAIPIVQGYAMPIEPAHVLAASTVMPPRAQTQQITEPSTPAGASPSAQRQQEIPIRQSLMRDLLQLPLNETTQPPQVPSTHSSIVGEERLRVMEEAAKIEAELAAIEQQHERRRSESNASGTSSAVFRTEERSVSSQRGAAEPTREEVLRRVGRERAEGMSNLQKLLRRAASTTPSVGTTPFVSPIKQVVSQNVSVSDVNDDRQIVRRTMTKLQALALQEGLGSSPVPAGRLGGPGPSASMPNTNSKVGSESAQASVNLNATEASTLMACMKRAYVARQQREVAAASAASFVDAKTVSLAEAVASSSGVPSEGGAAPLSCWGERADLPRPMGSVLQSLSRGAADRHQAGGARLPSTRPLPSYASTSASSSDRLHSQARALRPFTRLLLSSLIRGDRDMLGVASLEACADAANAALSQSSSPPVKGARRPHVAGGAVFVTPEDVRAMLIATGETISSGAVQYSTFVSSLVELAT